MIIEVQYLQAVGVVLVLVGGLVGRHVEAHLHEADRVVVVLVELERRLVPARRRLSVGVNY